MSEDSVLTAPPPRRPQSATLDVVGPLRFAGRGRVDPVAALAATMRRACAVAVDVDEVAALLEAGGINDRVAVKEYGQPGVFALAALVFARAAAAEAGSPPQVPARRIGEPPARRLVVHTLVRAALQVTPLVIGFGTVSEVDGSAGLVGTGTLVLGWGGGQTLAYLGHRVLAERGPGAAARLLGLGFAALAAPWCGVLAAAGVPWPRGFAATGVQLAFFAAVALALAMGGGPRAPATGRELVWLAPYWLTPCWLGAAGRWRSWRCDFGYALLYGGVGAGQAVLVGTVAHAGPSSAWFPLEAVPLLLGVPLVELTLLWHRRRVTTARSTLDNRVVFERRLNRLATGMTALLGLPVVLGGGLAVATWSGLRLPGGEPLAAAVMLVAVYALCLVLAAHRRAGTAAALVWWPAILVGVAGSWAPSLMQVAPRFPATLAAATLLGACVPGLLVAALVLRDPESYR